LRRQSKKEHRESRWAQTRRGVGGLHGSCRTGPHTALTIAERYGLCKRSSYDSPDIAHPRWIEAPSVRCYCTGESKSDTVYPRPGPLGAGTPRQRARRLIRLGAALLAPLPRARRRPDRSALRAGASAPPPAGYGRAGTRTATRAENTTSPSRALCSARARRAVSPPFTSPPSGACAGRLARARHEGSACSARSCAARRRSAPTFAGHYTLALWGCGAGCANGGVVDARSGQVWLIPFSWADAWEGDHIVCHHASDFDLTSELLIVEGQVEPGGRRCGITSAGTMAVSRSCITNPSVRRSPPHGALHLLRA
jgi:hypothetical protein